jgi:hypothetical protein
MSSVIRGKEEVAKLERELNELIHEYDMFFQGHERIEPLKKRKKIQRDILSLQNMRINNPVIKQKVANITRKFATFQRKWDNTWLQIEKGLFKIDRYKMKIHKKLRNKNEEKDETKSLNDDKNEITAQKDSEKGKKVKDYYNVLKKYELAKKISGETKKLNKEALNKKLQKQAEILKKKHKAKDIDFKVVKKDGKVTIKPILKR